MDRTQEISQMEDSAPNRGRLTAITRFGTRDERRAAGVKLRQWRAAARLRGPVVTDQAKAAEVTRQQVNVQLRRRGWPEIPKPAPTATPQERADARLRRMSLTPVNGQQPTNRTE